MDSDTWRIHRDNIDIKGVRLSEQYFIAYRVILMNDTWLFVSLYIFVHPIWSQSYFFFLFFFYLIIFMNFSDIKKYHLKWRLSSLSMIAVKCSKLYIYICTFVYIEWDKKSGVKYQSSKINEYFSRIVKTYHFAFQFSLFAKSLQIS